MRVSTYINALCGSFIVYELCIGILWCGVGCHRAGFGRALSLTESKLSIQDMRNPRREIGEEGTDGLPGELNLLTPNTTYSAALFSRL